MLLDGRQLSLHGEGRLLHLSPGDLALDQSVSQVTGLCLQHLYPLSQQGVLCPHSPQFNLVLFLFALHAGVLLCIKHQIKIPQNLY